MIRQILSAGAIAGALALPGLASAQLTGSYVGGSLGQSKFKDNCPGAPAAGCNKTDLGFKLFSGFEFGPIFGAELAFVDLGRVHGGGSSFNAVGGELVGTAQWPVSNAFSVYGKLGGYYLASAARGAVVGDEKTTDWTYAVGLKYRFAPQFSTRLEWQRYKDVGEPGTTGQTDINFLGASLMYHF